MSWDVGSVPRFTTGEERKITVEITNTGNSPLQRQVVLDAPDGWTVSVDGLDIIDLEVGQSTLVRMDVRPDRPGTATIGIALAQSTATNSMFEVAVTSSGEPVGTSGESGLNTTTALVLLGVILLAAFALLGYQSRRPRDESSSVQMTVPAMPMPAPMAAPVLAAAPPVVQPSSPPPMCWSCRQPITTAAVGCPSCGARYHADEAPGCTAGSLTHCVNCQGPAEAFVNA